MLCGILGASLLGHLLIDKAAVPMSEGRGTITTGEGTFTAGQGTVRAGQYF